MSRLDAKTGQLSNRSRIEAGGAFTSSPWAYNGKVFCLSEEGKTFVIAAGEKFELLRINPLDEMAQATPAIVGIACSCGRRADCIQFGTRTD